MLTMNGVGVDSLIVWQEPETEDDLALSFADKQNCKEFWYVNEQLSA